MWQGCGRGRGSNQVNYRSEGEANLNFSIVNFSAHSEDLNFEVKKYFFTPNEVKKYFFTPNGVNLFFIFLLVQQTSEKYGKVVKNGPLFTNR